MLGLYFLSFYEFTTFRLHTKIEQVCDAETNPHFPELITIDWPVSSIPKETTMAQSYICRLQLELSSLLLENGFEGKALP